MTTTAEATPIQLRTPPPRSKNPSPKLTNSCALCGLGLKETSVHMTSFQKVELQSGQFHWSLVSKNFEVCLGCDAALKIEPLWLDKKRLNSWWAGGYYWE